MTRQEILQDIVSKSGITKSDLATIEALLSLNKDVERVEHATLSVIQYLQPPIKIDIHIELKQGKKFRFKGQVLRYLAEHGVYLQDIKFNEYKEASFEFGKDKQHVADICPNHNED